MLFFNLDVHWENASLTIKITISYIGQAQQNYKGGSLYTFQILVLYVNIKKKT